MDEPDGLGSESYRRRFKEWNNVSSSRERDNAIHDQLAGLDEAHALMLRLLAPIQREVIVRVVKSFVGLTLSYELDLVAEYGFEAWRNSCLKRVSID